MLLIYNLFKHELNGIASIQNEQSQIVITY